MAKKNITSSDGFEKMLELHQQNRSIQLSDKVIDKLTIINFYDDMWERNRHLNPDEQLTKRQIIEEAYRLFRVDYSTLYRVWVEGQEKLGLSAIIPKDALTQYIISKSMTLIDREEAKAEPDTKAVAMLMKNLVVIQENLPDEEEDREPLPIPIFVFNPELLANHVNTSKHDIPKVLAELRAKKADENEKQKPKLKGGDYVAFEEK